MDKKLDYKAYQKFDKVFMLFGSVCNGSQHWIGRQSDQKKVAQFFDWALLWARTRASQLVDETYGDPHEAENTRARKKELAEKGFEVRDFDEESSVEVG